MPEETKQDAAENETVSLSEHKKLQRKFARRDQAAKKLEEQVEAILSSQSRQEALIEGLAAIVGADDDLKPVVQDMVAKNAERRKADTTSAELTARLGQTLDRADVDWEDDKFDSARRILQEINDSGDLTRAAELERVVQEVIAPDVNDFDERVRKAVDERLESVREGARVDTGETVSTGGPVRRSDLTLDPEKGGVEGLRKRATEAQKQMSN